MPGRQPTSRASTHMRTGTTGRAIRCLLAAKFMELLLFGVFGFFGVHTVFWFYRELREKFGGGGKTRGTGNNGRS